MLLAPSGTAFYANSGTNDISAYTVKSDGTQAMPTGAVAPLNSSFCEPGTPDRSAFSTISVFAVQIELDGGARLAVAEIGASSGAIWRPRFQ